MYAGALGFFLVEGIGLLSISAVAWGSSRKE